VLHVHVRAAYKNHQFTHSALDVQDIGALDSDHASLDAEWRQQDVRAIVLDDLAHFVETLKQDRIQLSVSHHDRLHEDFGGHDKIVQALLRTNDGLGGFTCNIDQIIWPALSTRGRVAEQARKGRREVDGGSSGRLDHLDVLASAPTDQGMHGQFELHRIYIALEL